MKRSCAGAGIAGPRDPTSRHDPGSWDDPGSCYDPGSVVAGIRGLVWRPVVPRREQPFSLRQVQRGEPVQMAELVSRFRGTIQLRQRLQQPAVGAIGNG
jgi:hypothetical protein